MANYCNDCSRFMTLPTCMVNLTVGTIAETETEVFIYLKNNTTGLLYRFSATSTVAGLIVFDITDPDADSVRQFTPIAGHDYELFVTLATATDLETVLNVTVNAIAYSCFGFTFERVYTNEDTLTTYTNQTLKLQA